MEFPGRSIAGVALIVVGIGLLTLTTGIVSIGRSTLPILFTVVGLIFLVRAFAPARGPANMLAGTALALTGLVLLLRNSIVPGLDLLQIWPLFMAIGGVSLAGYGVRTRGIRSASFIVPGVVFVLLGAVFLLFSLGVIEQSLKSVTVRWWPVLVVASGFLMIPLRRT